MKEIYSLTLMLFMIVTIVIGQRAKKKNSDLAKALIRVAYMVIIVVITSALAIVSPNEDFALAMQTMHYASTEWMLIFLLAFFERYIDGFNGQMPVRIIVYLVSAFNTVQMFLNCIFKHVVTCGYVEAYNSSFRVFHADSAWYQFHAYFCFMLASFALIALIGEAVKTKAFYRKKYYPAAIALAITMGLEIYCTFRNTLMDYALFGYMWLAIFLVYFSVYYVNSELITRTLSYITTATSDGVVCFDISGKCIYVNDVVRQLYKDKVDPEDDMSRYEEIFSKYGYGEGVEEKKWTESFGFDEDEEFYEVSYGNINDSRNEYIGSYFYLYDKTEDIKRFQHAEYQAYHDDLTGLYNDMGFKMQVAEILKNYADKEIYIVSADIKDFKLINDLFGYETGDAVLKKLAKAFSVSLPTYSPICRKNSDHFYFCVKKSDFSERLILEQLESVAKLVDNGAYHFLVHFGIYVVQEDVSDISIMCDYARMAMHKIKWNYDKYFAYFDKHMMDEIVRVKELVGEFDFAIVDNQFQMYLQPQVTTEGDVFGGEALVRWKHPEYGMIMPGEFIRIFEDSGLIYRLDQYIWEKAAQKLREWNDNGKGEFYISINISVKDFMYIDLYETFVGLVKKYAIKPGRLKLEITESAFMNEPEKQLEIISKLQEYGFQVEIDDFGSGYSSLNILKDMKADVLKIDMRFLEKTTAEERSKSIIKNIVQLAKTLNMNVISEGVEEKDQVIFLTDAGCDMFQGYYFNKPIPVEDFEAKYVYK